MQASKLQPALLGGVFIGVLSALPIVSAGNLCCCLWILAGGALAAYLLQQNQPAPLAVGDGAIVGLFAGLVGAVVQTILSIPILLAFGPMQGRFMRSILENADIPPEMRPALDNLAAGGAFSVVHLIVSFFFMIVVGAIFGTLGGMLGATIFKRNLPPAAPPPVPPPGFSPPFNPPPAP
jgi:uncharacterized membrane protein YedE/YeeE